MFEKWTERVAEQLESRVLRLLEDPKFEVRIQTAVLKALQTPEFQAQIVSYADGLVDRELQRVYQKVGGEISGVVRSPENNPLAGIMRRDGSINVKGILGMLLSGALQKGVQGSHTPISSENPFERR